MPRKKSTKSNAKSKKGGKKGGVSMMTKGAGVVVGGALGAAAAVLLADEKRRHQVVNTVGTLTSQAVDVVENVTDDAEKWRDRAYESLEGAKEDAQIKKTTKSTRKS